MKATNLKEAMRAMGNPIMMMETRSLMKTTNLKEAMQAMGKPIMMMTATVMMGKPIITMVVMRGTAAKMDTTGRRKRKDRRRTVIASTALDADVAAVAIATTALAVERVTMKETGKVVTIMENMATSMDMVTGVAVDMAMVMAMVTDEGDTKRKLVSYGFSFKHGLFSKLHPFA